jgi:hypothetical protein
MDILATAKTEQKRRQSQRNQHWKKRSQKSNYLDELYTTLPFVLSPHCGANKCLHIHWVDLDDR